MMIGVEGYRWRRSRYPLQDAPDGVAQSSSGKPLNKEADVLFSGPLQRNKKATNDPVGYQQAGPGDRAEHQTVVSQSKVDALSSHVRPENVQAYHKTHPAVTVSHHSISPTSDIRNLVGAQGTVSSVDQNHEFRMLSSWTRNLYPSGVTTDIAPDLHTSTSILRSAEENEQNSLLVPKSHKDGEASLEVRREEAVQGTAALAASPWRRLGYPLQSTVNGSSLRRSSSLPSPKEKSRLGSGTSRDQHGDRLSTSRDSSLQRRQIDSPRPSNRLLSTFSASPSASQPGSEYAPEAPISQLQNLGATANQTKIWQRQRYPLQALTGDGAVQARPTPLQAPEVELENVRKPSANQRLTTLVASISPSRAAVEYTIKTAASHVYDRGNADDESKTWNRHNYPLQARASDVAIQPCLTPPQSPDREPEHVFDVAAVQHQENDQHSRTSKTFHCQTYLLQSPVRDSSLQLSAPTSPSLAQGLQETDEPSRLQSRENILATNVIKRWRRQVYPLQSLESNSLFQPMNLQQPLRTEAAINCTPPLIHLPKNIPAVTNAEKHDSTGRTIVVCLDGTGDKFDNDNSNIVHLISALKKDDARQMTYYQAGVGTYGTSGLSGGLTAAMDMAVGSSLGLHVRDAYHFLMHTYKEGDRICIFGFSRGAYTARCLAGMIHKVGLLPPRNIQQISFAYEFYKKETPEGWKQSADFKKIFSINISVYFLGCFDSVASVGLIPRQLPLSSTPTNKPRYFRHAMALDERRAKFRVCRHEEKDWDDINLLHSELDRTPQCDIPAPNTAAQLRCGKSNHPNLTDEEHTQLTAHDEPFDTDVLEVWFVGAHADIGGGAVPNDERHKLAQIPLRWMIRQAFECNTGILFKTAVLAEYGLDVHMLWPKYERHSVPMHGPPPSFLGKYENGLPSKSIRRSKLIPSDKREKGEQLLLLKSNTDEDWTPEQVEDFFDAMSPVNDQLVQVLAWWMLEVLPTPLQVLMPTGDAYTKLGMNMGRYRGVDGKKPKLHWTVSQRMQHTGYRIEAGAPLIIDWQTVV